MNDFTGLYNIRLYTKDDRSFILATFLRGLYYGDSWFSQIPKDIFMVNYSKILERLIDSPSIAIHVACLPDDPNVILGYSIVSSDLKAISWIYVKSSWRRKGIGTALTPTHPLYATHLTALGKTIMEAKLTNTVLNPFYF